MLLFSLLAFMLTFNGLCNNPEKVDLAGPVNSVKLFNIKNDEPSKKTISNLTTNMKTDILLH
jgi:hypothetical protein